MGSNLTNIGEILAKAKKDADGTRSRGGFYSPEGDCVFFHNEDVPYARERVDDLLTVYRADDDDRIVGLQIKAIRKLPNHDALTVGVARECDGEKTVDLVWLLLLTFKKSGEPKVNNTIDPMEDASKATTYSEAIQAFGGKRMPVADLAQAYGR